MKRKSKNGLFSFFKKKAAAPPRARHSSWTVGQAMTAARKAGRQYGDTGEFPYWLEAKGLDARSEPLRRKLEAEFEAGVYDNFRSPAGLEDLEKPRARKKGSGSRSGVTRYKGYRIQREDDGSYTTDLDPGSLFDDLRQVKRFVDAETRRNPRHAIPNPSRRGALSLVRLGEITDRALRYRANRAAPRGKKICGYCGSQRNVEVEHIDGHEENSNPRNLLHACRSCNVRKANVFQAEGLGRKTRQYNPQRKTAGARTLKQWVDAAQSITGVSVELTPRQARDRILATSPAQRVRFAGQLAARRRQWEQNPSGYPRYEQYLWAVSHHARGEHDEGGAVIHAVPPEARSDYARRIYAFRRKTGSAPKTAKPRARRRRYSQAELAEVPF